MVYLVLFMLGSALGSFYNVVIYRIPRGMSIVSPSSHCPKCKASIRWYDNIPLVSYLILRGRCRKCGDNISLRYPIVETISGLLAVLSYYRWGVDFSALVLYLFFSTLLVLSLIDWDTFSLPENIMLSGTALGIISSAFRQDFTLIDSLLGILVGALPLLLIYLYYKKVRKMEGLGFGDVELMAFIGSVVGVWGVISAVFLGSILGLAYALPTIVKHKSTGFVIPFGPFLALGCFLGVFFDLKRIFQAGF